MPSLPLPSLGAHTDQTPEGTALCPPRFGLGPTSLFGVPTLHPEVPPDHSLFSVLLCLSEHGITLHPSLLSSQFNPTYESEKPDLNHLTVGNQDGPGLEKRVGSAISVISNAVEGMSCWVRVLVSAGGPR